MSGLVNNQIYYVVNSNSTSLKLSDSQGGANINITAASSVSADIDIGHYLQGYIPAVEHTAFLNPDNSEIVEYYNNTSSRFESFKYFAIKVVLTSTDRVNYPRLNDIRAIALQK